MVLAMVTVLFSFTQAHLSNGHVLRLKLDAEERVVFLKKQK
jgi:hypothetical protein